MNSRFTECSLLRIYLSEGDTKNGKPLLEQLMHAAQEKKISGATVLKGVLGYGRSTKVHSAHLIDIAEHLPLIVEITDSDEKLYSFLDYLDVEFPGILVSLEKLRHGVTGN